MKIKKVVIAVISFILVFSLLGCSAIEYKKAEGLYEQERWNEAREIFLELGEYENSQLRVYDCNYQLARICYLEGKTEEAVSLLAQATSHEDSIRLLHQIMFDLIVEEYTPSVEKAVEHLNAYQSKFVADLYKKMFSGVSSFEVTFDYEDSDYKAVLLYYSQIEDLYKRYNAVFTAELVESLDPEMQNAHMAFVETMDYSLLILSTTGYHEWLLSTISGNVTSYSPDELGILCLQLEKVANDL